MSPFKSNSRFLTQIQLIPMDLGCPIIHASCADPYLTILTEDGQVILLILRETRGAARLHVQPANLLFVSLAIVINGKKKLLSIQKKSLKGRSFNVCILLFQIEQLSKDFSLLVPEAANRHPLRVQRCQWYIYNSPFRRYRKL